MAVEQFAHSHVALLLRCQAKTGILPERQQLVFNYSDVPADEKTLAEFKLHSGSSVLVKVVRSAADIAHAHSHPTLLQLSIKTLTGEFVRCSAPDLF